MKVFCCQNCGQLLYFENTRCERCGLGLGYLPDLSELSALQPAADGAWTALADTSRQYRYCANFAKQACNWMIPFGGSEQFCPACRLNRTIPNIDDPEQMHRWRLLEDVKRRLIYSLIRLNIPLVSKRDDPEAGLAFDFLADASEGANVQERVMTGHSNGLITIDTAEANPVERERRRLDLAEPYRTLPGHLRHEVGHYYWERSFRAEDDLAAFRAHFGDERADYGQALQTYYANGAPPDWQERFVSAYASAHPWEDWAETWAHYLHILDMTETASAFGLATLAINESGQHAISIPQDPYDPSADFDAVISAWLPITYAVNSLNRSMGQPDLYPFVLSSVARDKLRFVHHFIRGRGQGRAAA